MSEERSCAAWPCQQPTCGTLSTCWQHTPKCEECDLPSQMQVCETCKAWMRPCTCAGGRVKGQVKQKWKSVCATCYRTKLTTKTDRPAESTKPKPKPRSTKQESVAAEPLGRSIGCMTWATYTRQMGMERMTDDEAAELLRRLEAHGFRVERYPLWIKDPRLALGRAPRR
ncbi:hypothetical protein GHT06_003776 [Daphnia sinensis]|uniref:Uncharacterized protein n=1 Tax=Daphnia sinensis TaxID=1820382 RepID=A0AAD5KU53_9CRUS|nr:hypothetical protein GHT06_003776 [Daphnia sinensis]